MEYDITLLAQFMLGAIVGVGAVVAFPYLYDYIKEKREK